MASSNSRPGSGGPAGAPIDWSAVWAEHGRWLRTVVIARVGERLAVDEVLQDVALAAVAQRSPLVDHTKLAPWLYRLAVRQSLLCRRGAGRQRRLAECYGQLARSTADDLDSRDPLEWLLADERRRLVRAALGRLTRRDAELLLLKYTEDWSYRELAGRLGVSESAIEARLHRARARLRAELTALNVIEVSQ
jgi:RNA polymerase sigma-70 factor (ECF subfamily)